MRSFTDKLIALQSLTVISAITALLPARLPAGARGAGAAVPPPQQSQENSRGQ
jgi:hypothetical protein